MALNDIDELLDRMRELEKECRADEFFVGTDSADSFARWIAAVEELVVFEANHCPVPAPDKPIVAMVMTDKGIIEPLYEMEVDDGDPTEW